MLGIALVFMWQCLNGVGCTQQLCTLHTIRVALTLGSMSKTFSNFQEHQFNHFRISRFRHKIHFYIDVFRPKSSLSPLIPPKVGVWTLFEHHQMSKMGRNSLAKHESWRYLKNSSNGIDLWTQKWTPNLNINISMYDEWIRPTYWTTNIIWLLGNIWSVK